MKTSIFALGLALSTQVLADTYTQRLFVGDQTKITDQNGDQIVVSCEGSGNIPSPSPAPVETELECTAHCNAGNNSYYSGNVVGYFDRTFGNHSEEMLSLCYSTLPNEIQRRGSYLSGMSCREVSVNPNGYTCSALCNAGNNPGAYNSTVSQYFRSRSGLRVWDSLMQTCQYSLPPQQLKGSYITKVKCE